MTGPAPAVVRRVVQLSLDTLSCQAAGPDRVTSDDLIPRPGSPPTALAVPRHPAVWERLEAAPSGAVQEIAAEAAAFCCLLLRRASHGAGPEVRRGHDAVVVPLLWHLGFFGLEGLSAPAESARSGAVDLLVRLDQLALALCGGCRPEPRRRTAPDYVS